MSQHRKTRQRRSGGRLGRILRRVLLGPPVAFYVEDVPVYDCVGDQFEFDAVSPYDEEETPGLPAQDDPLLEAEGYLRKYIRPIVGDHPFDVDQDEVTRFDLIRRHPYLPDETQDFPVVCANGCPEGYRGQHKFSCDLAGQTRLGDCQPGPDPAPETTQFRKVS